MHISFVTLTLNSKEEKKSKILFLWREKTKRENGVVFTTGENTFLVREEEEKKNIIPVTIVSLHERQALSCLPAFFTLSPFIFRNRFTQA